MLLLQPRYHALVASPLCEKHFRRRSDSRKWTSVAVCIGSGSYQDCSSSWTHGRRRPKTFEPHYLLSIEHFLWTSYCCTQHWSRASKRMVKYPNWRDKSWFDAKRHLHRLVDGGTVLYWHLLQNKMGNLLYPPDSIYQFRYINPAERFLCDLSCTGNRTVC